LGRISRSSCSKLSEPRRGELCRKPPASRPRHWRRRPPGYVAPHY
jgi:hypothetical protein